MESFTHFICQNKRYHPCKMPKLFNRYSIALTSPAFLPLTPNPLIRFLFLPNLFSSTNNIPPVISILLMWKCGIESLYFNRLILRHLFECRDYEGAQKTKMLHQPFMWTLKIIKPGKIYLAYLICICLTHILQGYFLSQESNLLSSIPLIFPH